MLEFYIDYSREHLDQADFLSVGMLLKAIAEHDPASFEEVKEFIAFYDPAAQKKVDAALDEHTARLHKMRARRR